MKEEIILFQRRVGTPSPFIQRIPGIEATAARASGGPILGCYRYNKTNRCRLVWGGNLFKRKKKVRNQENTLSTKKTIKKKTDNGQEKKKENTLSAKKATKEKRKKLSFFLGRDRVFFLFFLTFLFSFINSHLRRMANQYLRTQLQS